MLAGLLATVTVLLLVVLIGAPLALWREARLHAAADAARSEAVRALVDLHMQQGLAADVRGSRLEAALFFAHAARLAREDPVRERYNRIRVHTWLENALVPVRALPHPGEELVDLAFHPGGRLLLTRTQTHRVRLWDLVTGQPLPWVPDA